MAALWRWRRLALGLALSMTAFGVAAASDYPSKAISVVVPFVAGGPIDVVARRVAESLSRALGQPAVVINRPGAGGTIGSTAVARAKPDGYTVLITLDYPIVLNPSFLKSVSYDPVKDFLPIALVGDGGDNVVVVSGESALRTVSELAESLQKKNGEGNYTSTGIGSPGHVQGELFRREARFDALHVAERGGPQALTEVMAGRVAYAFLPIGLVVPQVATGKLKALAVASSRRSPFLPNVPTIVESGYPGFSSVHWWIVALAPAGTPSEIIDRLNAEIRRIAGSSELKPLLETQGLVASDLSPEKVGERIRGDFSYWAAALEKLKLQAE